MLYSTTLLPLHSYYQSQVTGPGGILFGEAGGGKDELKRMQTMTRLKADIRTYRQGTGKFKDEEAKEARRGNILTPFNW
jgi:hypothetical protein